MICRQRDSELGHYTCNATNGAKICLPGWRGVHCTVKLLGSSVVSSSNPVSSTTSPSSISSLVSSVRAPSASSILLWPSITRSSLNQFQPSLTIVTHNTISRETSSIYPKAGTPVISSRTISYLITSQGSVWLANSRQRSSSASQLTSNLFLPTYVTYPSLPHQSSVVIAKEISPTVSTMVAVASSFFSASLYRTKSPATSLFSATRGHTSQLIQTLPYPSSTQAPKVQPTVVQTTAIPSTSAATAMPSTSPVAPTQQVSHNAKHCCFVTG